MNGNANCKLFCKNLKIGYSYRYLFRPNGVTFTAPAGTTEFAQKWQPKQGDIVTFKHRGYLLATKKPKFPTLFRVRHDLNWDTVVQNWEDKKFSVTPSMHFPPLMCARFKLIYYFLLLSVIPLHRKKHKPKGYWANPSNVREFFCKFAEEKGFDPMDAHNWENLHTAELLQKVYPPPQSPSFHMLLSTNHICAGICKTRQHSCCLTRNLS